MITKDQAATATAAFWANLLISPMSIASPDLVANALLSIGRHSVPAVTIAKASAFESALKGILMAKLDSSVWSVSNPILGGVYRTVSSYHSPGKELSDAANAVDLKGLTFLLPSNTTVWMDPDGVKVRVGRGGEKIPIAVPPRFVIWDYEAYGDPTAEQLESEIEGFVKIVFVSKVDTVFKCIAFCADEYIMDLPYNKNASRETARTTFGNAVLLRGMPDWVS